MVMLVRTKLWDGKRVRGIESFPVGPKGQRDWRFVNWSRIGRPDFHGLVAAICGCERRAVPGACRNHWRRARARAIAHYESRFGPVPIVIKERHLRRGLAFYRHPEYEAWSQRAYSSPLEPLPRGGDAK